jgi:AraC-like DNA-binding protein
MTQTAVSEQAFHRTVASYMGPFRMHWSERLHPSPRFGLVHAPVGSCALMIVDQDMRYSVERGPLNSFFALQVLEKGTLTARLPAGAVAIGPGQGFVVDPALPIRLDFDNTRSVLLRLDESLIRAAGLRRNTAIALARNLYNRIDMNRGAGLSLRRFVEYVAADAAEGHLAKRSLAERQWMEKLLTANFIACLMEGEKPGPAPSPRAVDTIERAEDFMRRHIGEALTVVVIARAAGVPERTLNDHFRRVHGIAPSQYLRRLRLEGVRRDLLADTGRSLSITEIASSWGFSHFGRFAEFYHMAFGETPSETRRRAGGAGRSAGRAD